MFCHFKFSCLLNYFLLKYLIYFSFSLQRQLKFLASKLDSPSLNATKNVNTTSVVSGSILSTTITSPNRLSLAGTDLNTSGLMNGSFSYKPLISLPSVGFGAALGLNLSSNYFNSPSSQSLKNRFVIFVMKI